MPAVTVAGADSADALYREGAVLIDLEHGEISWNGAHHPIANLLHGASVVLVYGARSVQLDDVARLAEGWGLPVWTLADADLDELRQRISDVAQVRSRT